MELNNEFEVAVPVSTAWGVLTDLERIAPCMPGAQLEEVEGDEYRGLVRVKVGPITASYKGVAKFLEKDDAGHKAVLKAEGRETRGQGNASATITALLAESAAGTKVTVATDLNITGKVAQFGRGVLAEVSGKLLDQFVQNLEKTVLTPEGGGEAGAAGASGGGSATKAEGTTAAGGPSEQTGPALSPKPRRTRARTEMPSSTASDENGAVPEGGGTAGAFDETPAAGTEATESGEGGEPAAAQTGRPAEGTKGDGETTPSGVRRIEGPPAQPVDLGAIAGDSIVKRILPFASIAGAIFLIRIVVYAMKRRKK